MDLICEGNTKFLIIFCQWIRGVPSRQLVAPEPCSLDRGNELERPIMSQKKKKIYGKGVQKPCKSIYGHINTLSNRHLFICAVSTRLIRFQIPAQEEDINV